MQLPSFHSFKIGSDRPITIGFVNYHWLHDFVCALLVDRVSAVKMCTKCTHFHTLSLFRSMKSRYIPIVHMGECSLEVKRLISRKTGVRIPARSSKLSDDVILCFGISVTYFTINQAIFFTLVPLSHLPRPPGRPKNKATI